MIVYVVGLLCCVAIFALAASVVLFPAPRSYDKRKALAAANRERGR